MYSKDCAFKSTLISFVKLLEVFDFMKGQGKIQQKYEAAVYKVGEPGLQIISPLAPVKLSGQTYFGSDISHFWPDKHR